MTKTAGTTISRADMKSLLLAAMVEHGMATQEAERIGDQQISKLWKKYGGCLRYFRKDNQNAEKTEIRRKAIFMEWWTDRPTGHALELFMAKWEIGERRLQQIVAEGRKKKWAK